MNSAAIAETDCCCNTPSLVSGLLSQGLIRPSGSDAFSVAKLELLDQLIQLAATEQGVSYTPNPTPLTPLANAQSVPTVQILGTEDPTEITTRLKDMLNALRQRLREPVKR